MYHPRKFLTLLLDQHTASLLVPTLKQWELAFPLYFSYHTAKFAVLQTARRDARAGVPGEQRLSVGLSWACERLYFAVLESNAATKPANRKLLSSPSLPALPGNNLSEKD